MCDCAVLYFLITSEMKCELQKFEGQMKLLVEFTMNCGILNLHSSKLGIPKFLVYWYIYLDLWFEFTITICCGTLILHNNSSLVRLFLNARPAHLVLLELHDAFLINFLLWEQYGLLHHREQLLPRKVFQLETGEDRLISAVLILGIPSQEILEPFASGRNVSRRPIRSGVAIFRVKQQD